jgi:hypothetical protein
MTSQLPWKVDGKNDSKEERLKKYLRRIVKKNGCWVWIGAKRAGRVRNGKMQYYGVVTIGYKNKCVHRVIYEMYKGKIKKGLELDHLCRNTLCVNPKHLEAVTHSENCKRGTAWHHFVEEAKKITHCPQGHEYTKENTYIYDGQRRCKTCGNIREKIYLANKRRKLGIKTWAERYPKQALQSAEGK